MSFQAYLDNIKAKTGKTPSDFRRLADKEGLLASDVKAMQVIGWLKKDFGLGHGHAMAVYATLKADGKPEPGADQLVARHFVGAKASWRPAFDGLLTKLRKGGDVLVEPAGSYLSLLHGTKKFAIIVVMAGSLDFGIKLKDAAPTERLQNAGTWNRMVTHRVRIANPNEIDAELLTWLRDAYTQNSG